MNVAESVAAKTEDGKLTLEEIEQLAEQVGQIRHPRQRAKEAQSLRNAIRDAENLSEADRREAVRMLNQAMAKQRPAWAKPVADGVENRETTQSTTNSERLIDPTLQNTSLEAPPIRTLGARRL